jgi:hypothetical protein
LYVKSNSVKLLLDYNKLVGDFDVVTGLLKKAALKYETKDLLGEVFTLGLSAGKILGATKPNLIEELIGPIKSMVGSIERSKGHEPVNTRYAQCVKISKKYWANEGVMNHIELAALLYDTPEISLVTTDQGEEKEISNKSLSKYLSHVAPENRKFGNRKVKRNSFSAKKENIIKLGTKKANEVIKNKKTKDFNDRTETPLSEVVFVSVDLKGEDALPKLK